MTYESLRSLWPRTGGTETLSMQSLRRRVEDPADYLCLTPDYQRGRAWTDDQCARFLGFLAEGGQAPTVFVQRWPAHTTQPDEVVDGLQRLTAILRFLRGEVPLETTEGAQVFLREFAEGDQRRLIGFSGPTIVVQYVLCPTRADVLRLYLRLNRGGTPHTDAEIERVRALLAECP